MIGKINLHNFIAATRKKRALEDEIKVIKAKIAKVEEKLLAEMADAGVQRVTADGATVYIQRQLWASKAAGVSDEDAAAALIEAGLEDMVKLKFNSSTVSAYVRELDKNEQALPPELAAVLSIAEKFSVRMVGDN